MVKQIRRSEAAHQNFPALPRSAARRLRRRCRKGNQRWRFQQRYNVKRPFPDNQSRCEEDNTPKNSQTKVKAANKITISQNNAETALSNDRCHCRKNGKRCKPHDIIGHFKHHMGQALDTPQNRSCFFTLRTKPQTEKDRKNNNL